MTRYIFYIQGSKSTIHSWYSPALLHDHAVILNPNPCKPAPLIQARLYCCLLGPRLKSINKYINTSAVLGAQRNIHCCSRSSLTNSWSPSKRKTLLGRCLESSQSKVRYQNRQRGEACYLTVVNDDTHSDSTERLVSERARLLFDWLRWEDHIRRIGASVSLAHSFTRLHNSSGAFDQGRG